MNLLAIALMLAAGGTFREQVLEPDIGVGYAVEIADMNADGRPDVVAISGTHVMWFENPSWTKHVVSEKHATPDHVCFATHDIDGDGKLDIALGADWQARNTESAGTLQWLKQGEPWTMHAIGSEPTLHRIRWADVDGDGRRELIVAPLHGRGTSGPQWWNGAGARLMVMRPPDFKPEVASDSLHVVHNFWVANFDDDSADELITASYEGVHVLDRGADGAWRSTRIGEGHQEGDRDKGAGEVKLGRLRGGGRYIATIEPWHANHLVVYIEEGSLWQRRVLTDQLGGGHALWTADLDGDGDDELIFGWREKGTGDYERPGVGIVDPSDWTAPRIIDAGGMAAEDLTAGDLNGDGRPDIVASGRATHNLKIYWNEGGR